MSSPRRNRVYQVTSMPAPHHNENKPTFPRKRQREEDNKEEEEPEGNPGVDSPSTRREVSRIDIDLLDPVQVIYRDRALVAERVAIEAENRARVQEAAALKMQQAAERKGYQAALARSAASRKAEEADQAVVKLLTWRNRHECGPRSTVQSDSW